MTNAAKSILFFAIYVVIAGLILIFTPDSLMVVLGVPPAADVWARMFGVLLVPLGAYYIQTARDNNTAFFRLTVWGRAGFAAGVLLLALATPTHRGLIFIAILDFSGALWTWISLRRG